MVKKFRKIPLVLLASTLLVACGTDGNEEESEQPAETTEQNVEESEVSASESEEEVETEEEAVEEVDAAETEEAGSEEVEPEEQSEEESSEAAASGDITDAYLADDTSESEPVPFGEWGQIYTYSTENSDQHPAYLRITNVTSESANADYIQSAFDEHNELAEHDFEEFDPADVELPSDVEWLIVDYEIHYPEDFPAGEFGIQESSGFLTATNPEGGGIPSQDGTSTYIGLGTPEALFVETTDNMQPGETRTSRNLYAMVTDYTDYIFKLQSNLPNEEGYETIFFESK